MIFLYIANSIREDIINDHIFCLLLSKSLECVEEYDEDVVKEKFTAVLNNVLISDNINNRKIIYLIKNPQLSDLILNHEHFDTLYRYEEVIEQVWSFLALNAKAKNFTQKYLFSSLLGGHSRILGSAFIGGSIEIIDDLINEKNVSTGNIRKNVGFYIKNAVYNGDLELFKYICEIFDINNIEDIKIHAGRYSDIYSNTGDYISILDLAARTGAKEIYNYLIEQGVGVTDEGVEVANTLIASDSEIKGSLIYNIHKTQLCTFLLSSLCMYLASKKDLSVLQLSSLGFAVSTISHAFIRPADFSYPISRVVLNSEYEKLLKALPLPFLAIGSSLLFNYSKLS